MKKTIEFVVKAVLLGMMLGTGARIVVTVLDVEIQHFEDGSGRITYCLPFEDAGPFLGGCN